MMWVPDNSGSRGLIGSGRRRAGALFLFLGLVAAAVPPAGAANVLRALNYSPIDGQAVRVEVLTEQTLEKTPANFSISDPPRVVIDLPGTTSGLGKKHYEFAVGDVENMDVIEAAGRTRLVVNLKKVVPYGVLTEDSRLIITLGEVRASTATTASVPAPVPTGAPAEASRAPSPASAPVPARVKPLADSVASPISAATGAAMANIDFRRTATGGGQVVLTFTGGNIRVAEQKRAGRVVLEMNGVGVPESLQKTFDVTDFGTPVKAMQVDRVGTAGARVDIRTAGSYDYTSSQTGSVFTAEFAPKAAPKTAKVKPSLRDKSYTGKQLSLNFQDIEIRSVLQLLSDFTGLNMVVSDTVRGNITLRLQNVPWDQAMDIILTTKGLTSRRYGNVIMVAPIEEVAARERLELEAEKQLEELAPLVSELVQVNYAKATELSEILKEKDNRLLSERGSVTVDDRTNTLLIQDTATSIEQIRQLVADLDRPVRQVLIESRVVIANDDFARELGVRFGFNTSGSVGDSSILVAGGKPGMTAGTSSFAPGIENPAGSGQEALMVNLPATLGGSRGGALNLLLGKAGSYLLQLELSAMQQEGRGEVVSSPRVITSDQQKAVIKQGIEIPYQEASSSGATTVSFKEAVLKLEVTPHITPDERIIMDLEVTKDQPDFARSVLGVPPVDTRSVQTSVLVDNGETVVLGGVFEESRSTSQDKVPFLGDLPGVGYLFRSTETTRQKQELLIFVTPKVLKETLSFER